ncbi:MAG: rhomboid family intramembrane serine protease [Bacteroidetes bacterium]|jgi:membrane associated rhomboid family serine protease|nr:rhomboid family intramembrane serine protease [Bacteroidota bacterium]
MSVIEEVQYRFKAGNAIVRIILINVLVFILVAFLQLLGFLFQANLTSSLLSWLSVPASLVKLLYQPWSLITYMFLHTGIFHILFNMLWLYWIGQLFQQYLGNTKTYQAYFLGGIFGAIIYILSYNFFPVFQGQAEVATAVGASAGVLSIVVATATLLPDYSISLLFIGAIRLKYIALFSVLMDLISIPQGNPGGHIAHLGGAAFGFIFIKLIYNKSSTSNYLDRFFEWFSNGFQSSPKLKVKYKATTKTNSSQVGKPSQEEIDAILDKINRGGYENLSKKEKEILFKASK